jgi:hypothetical protein
MPTLRLQQVVARSDLTVSLGQFNSAEKASFMLGSNRGACVTSQGCVVIDDEVMTVV